MLTVEFVGGLGNQLFQLAALDHISRRTGRVAVIECAGTSGHSNENYFNSLFGHWSVAQNPPPFPLNIQEGSYIFSDWTSPLATPLHRQSNLLLKSQPQTASYGLGY